MMEILTAVATVAAILLGVWKMVDSSSSRLEGQIRESHGKLEGQIRDARKESTREHDKLEGQIRELDKKFTGRFDQLDERDRKRLSAMLAD